MASWGGAWRLQAIITGIVCASAVALSAPASSSGDAAGKPEPAPSREVSRVANPVRAECGAHIVANAAECVAMHEAPVGRQNEGDSVR